MDQNGFDMESYINFEACATPPPAGSEAVGEAASAISAVDLSTANELTASCAELGLPSMTGVELSQPSVITPTFGNWIHETSFLRLYEKCTCPACFQERPPTIVTNYVYRAGCRMPSCSQIIHSYRDRSFHLNAHEKSHYFHQGKYRCAEKECTASFKQWRDLKRHYRAKHCTKTPEFPCNVIGCQYGGENGFHRKDKLTSHYKNVHQGRAITAKPQARLLPAPAGGMASGSGFGI